MRPPHLILWNYAYGLARPADARRVENWLIADPRAFDELAMIHQQMAILEKAPEEVLYEPVPDRLLRVIRTARSQIGCGQSL